MKLTNPVLMGKIGAAHGIKGEVRVKSFTDDPMAIGDYGSLCAKDGRKFKITNLRPQKTVVIVKFKGVNGRDEAENLNGVELYIDRSSLPDELEDDEFYISDLIGCRVQTGDGTDHGKIIAVPDFGAGDLLEISGSAAKSWYLEFTHQNVPAIDLENQVVTIVLPSEVSERDHL